MLVVISIGNTSITTGTCHGGKLIGNYRLTTRMKHMSGEYGFMVMDFLDVSKVQPADIKDVIVSSIISKIVYSFLSRVREYIHREPILIDSGIKTGTSVKVENPEAVGADRIVDAAGTCYEYGGSCLVVDYDAATIFDYVDANENSEYDAVTLGIEIGAQAMWTQAAKLPETETKKPASILAGTTTTSMQTELVYDYIRQSEYIIKESKKALDVDVKVIATGGLGKIIYRNTDKIDIYDRNLISKGLKYIYEKYTTERKKQVNAVKRFTP